MSDGPINYMPGLAPTNPLQAFGQGYGMLNQITSGFTERQNAQNQALAQAQAAQAQAQAAAEQKKKQQELTAKVFGGNGTAEDRANLLFMIAPEQAKIAQTAFDSMDKDIRTQKALEAGKIAAAYDAGFPEIGKQLMEAKIRGQREKGDEEGAQLNEKFLAAEDTTPGHISNYLKNTMALFPEGREMLDSQLKVEEQPHKLNLTDAQAAEAWANSLKARYANGKGLTPEQVINAEADLRKEYNTNTANYQTIKNAYGKIINSDKTGAGDIALVYSYMKMLDPTSVVREGEFATAQNAGGIPNAVLAAYNKALNGQSLADPQREDMRKQSKKLYDSALESEKIVRQGIERVAKNNDFNLDNIFYQPEGATEPSNLNPKGRTEGLNYFFPSGAKISFPDAKALAQWKKDNGIE